MTATQKIGFRTTLALIASATALACAPQSGSGAQTTMDVPPTRLGLNLSGLATYNRQQVFTNLIAQSEWFTNRGDGWKEMPTAQLDARGWVTHLDAGQVAPRPLVLPDQPIGKIAVRCTYAGDGDLSVGGIAHLTSSSPGAIDLDLVSEGGDDEGAWIQLDRTNPADPLRRIDCRDRSRPASEVFTPAFVASLKGFSAIRFLDWQQTNMNRTVPWSRRARSDDASQIPGDGVAIENMVSLANQARVDPWFLMPYNADATYIQGFATLVHDTLAPDRTVFVELGNEVWNDMFEGTQQARREGIAAGLAPDDPVRAQTRRYAQKIRDTMQIWTRVFADRPQRLVRVAATINVWPEQARTILTFEDLPRWIDALATAPYMQLDLAGRGPQDVDWVFSRMPAVIDEAIDFAAQNKALAAQYHKRYITYEGGQHLVTGNLDLARRVQRDPRMAGVYRAYLDAWRSRIGDQLTLYASTTPIGDSGAWGLREYAGQPLAETPKLRAVQAFLAANR